MSRRSDMAERGVHSATQTAAFSERVRALVNEGLSDAQIARALGRTRNSIIGKRHRLFLAGNRRLTWRDPVEASTISPVELETGSPKPKRVRKRPPLPMRPVGPLYHPIMDLEPGRCHYPIGNVRDKSFRFCLASTNPEQTYCQEHHDLCTTGPYRRRAA